jgi:hypothetical protein
MKLVGVLGPSNIKESKNMRKVCEDISCALIKHKFGAIISPDKKSTAEYFAKVFKKQKGSFLVGTDYSDDKDCGYKGLNRDICDELWNCETWENQPKFLVNESKALIVLDLSVGVTWELCLTKFYWSGSGGKIFIITETNKERLPEYMNKSLPIEYISINELDDKLKVLAE